MVPQADARRCRRARWRRSLTRLALWRVLNLRGGRYPYMAGRPPQPSSGSIPSGHSKGASWSAVSTCCASASRLRGT